MNNKQTEKDSKQLHRAQVHLWAAYGWKVEYRYKHKTDWESSEPGWNWGVADYRIAEDHLQIPEGYELVPIGDQVDEQCLYLNTDDDLPGKVEWKRRFYSEQDLDPCYIYARPVAGPSEDQVRTKTDAERIAELERRVEELEDER
jgi:hypothetical protein